MSRELLAVDEARRGEVFAVKLAAEAGKSIRKGEKSFERYF